ncbi:TlpA disulfide reductase family protein [Aerosticca soli]|uniref:Thioredoxin n=1 Tax=Aerosticca soli TaxID=2010829 RepID=A0A2Z6E3H4_9GAMM|nr:TlpA disulfide reductase family protein [Aerosticca soli]BBD79593.1 thioredoxin [Aerosticca soli]
MKKTLCRGLLGALLLVLAGSLPAATPPDFTLTTLDGGHFRLAAQRGHWVIVNFWATWCAPCIKEMPELSAYVARHRDKIAAIGIAYDDTDPAELKAFVAAHPVAYPIARLTLDAALPGFAAPRVLPTTYLIAPDGSVVRRFDRPVGAAELGAVTGLP